MVFKYKEGCTGGRHPYRGKHDAITQTTRIKKFCARLFSLQLYLGEIKMEATHCSLQSFYRQKLS